MEHHVGRIRAHDLDTLMIHRDLTGWWLRPDGRDFYLLKVPAFDESLFQKLPLLGRWTLDGSGRMIREGKRVPEALLPEDGWQSLAGLLPIAPPSRGAPGMPPAAVGFTLVVDDAGHPATALLCRREDFTAWATTAFAPRIECLRFACCEDDRAFVAGTPLPPLPGAGFHRLGRIWLPCGWQLPDFTWPELIEDMLALGNNRFCILHPDGSHEELDMENLIPATRSSVRSSALA